MLTLWYIVLGWKEYNKPFRRAEQPAKPVEPAKKANLIPPRKDGPTLSTDNKKPEPPKSIPTDPRSPASRDPAVNNRNHETSKIGDDKSNFSSSKPPEVSNILNMPKMPEPPKVASKTPELPKTPETPKVPPKTPETPKMPDLKLAPELPKKSDAPKTPEPPKVTPKTPESPKGLDTPKLPEGLKPSRRPESVMPEFPPSGKNPYFPQPNPSEFDLPPYLPGTPQSKPLSRDDELFTLGTNFNSPSSNKPTGNLRDLSYAKGEFPGENATAKVQEKVSRLPKYLEQSVISNPDSLESDEEDEDEDV